MFAVVNARFHAGLRQFVAVALIASLLSSVALVLNAPRANAVEPLVCSGERVQGYSGFANATDGVPFKFNVTVPANHRLWLEGSVTVTEKFISNKYELNLSANPSFDEESPAEAIPLHITGDAGGPSTRAFRVYRDWGASGGTSPIELIVKAAGGAQLEVTPRIVPLLGHASAVAACPHPHYDGYVLGGRNGAEPWVCDCAVGQPVSVQSGNFFHEFSDFAFTGRGTGLGLSRVYNSADAMKNGPFGFGWHSSAFVSLSKTNGPVGGVTTETVSIRQETGSVTSFRAVAGGYAPVGPYTDATLGFDAGDPAVAGDGTWTFVRGVNTTFRFDEGGRLRDISDPNGNTITHSYANGDNDASDEELYRIADETGRYLQFTWSPIGDKVTKVQDSSPTPRSVEFAYSTSGEMQWFTDVETKKWSFGYDSANRHWMTSMRDPNTHAEFDSYGNLLPGETATDLVNEYDAAGRVKKQVDRENGVTEFNYSFDTATGRDVVDVKMPAVSDNATGYTTRYAYAHGLLQSKIDGYGTADASETKFEYDPVSLGPTKITNGRQHATEHLYTGFDRTWTKNALGHESSATFNARHQPETVTDFENVTTTYDYDTAGNLESVSTPLLDENGLLIATQLTTFNRDAASDHPEDVISIVDPRGKTTEFEHTDAGWKKAVKAPEGRTTTFANFTFDGKPQLVTQPRGNKVGAVATNFQTKLAYNKRGQVTSAKNQLGKETQYSYDHNGNVETMTAVTTPTNLVTTYLYTRRTGSSRPICRTGRSRRPRTTRTAAFGSRSTARTRSLNTGTIRSVASKRSTSRM